MEKARKEAAEKAVKYAEEERKRAEDARIAKELKAKEAAERKAARLPDKVKLQNYLVALFGIPIPELKTPEGKEVWDQIDTALEDLNIRLGQIVEGL